MVVLTSVVVSVCLIAHIVIMVPAIVLIVYVARTEYLTLGEIVLGVVWAAIPFANITLLAIILHTLMHTNDPAYHFNTDRH